MEVTILVIDCAELFELLLVQFDVTTLCGSLELFKILQIEGIIRFRFAQTLDN